MEWYLASIYVFLTVIFFKIRVLNVKKLQERWVSSKTCLYWQRFALFPTIILLIISYKPEYLHIIISNPKLILYIFFMLIFWVSQEFIWFYVMWKISSLSFLNAFYSIINIPIYMMIWLSVNHDYPNYFTIFSLVILAISMYIKPTHNNKKNKNMFSHNILFIIFIASIWIILDGTNNAFHRELFQNLNAVFFWTWIWMFLAMLWTYIFFLFSKVPESEKKLLQEENNKWLYFSIAPLWFIGSIPEWFSLANIPIYTVLAIGSISFVIDVISDIKNERIVLNSKTYIFIILVLISIALSVLSLK
jgi:hypothetical protein